MSDERTGKQISDFDQMMTGIEDLSTAIAEYRNGLIENGIPERIADDMVKDISLLFWKKSLGMMV